MDLVFFIIFSLYAYYSLVTFVGMVNLACGVRDTDHVYTGLLTVVSFLN